MLEKSSLIISHTWLSLTPCNDELLQELHFLVSSASGPAMKEILLNKKFCSVYKPLYDGSLIIENSCLHGDEVPLILYMDDFEVCSPLGTSQKQHKVTAVYWVFADIPATLRSTLTSIYLDSLCKADDVTVWTPKSVGPTF